MERAVIEYLANAFWQLPLLAGGAWLLLRMTKMGPAAQHRVWLAVLGLSLLLPLHGTERAGVAAENGGGVGIGALTDGGGPAGYSLTTISASALEGVGSVSKHAAGPVGVEALWAKLSHTARARRVSVDGRAARWIAMLWMGMALLGLLRIVLAWSAARRLVANSQDGGLSERLGVAVAECARRVGVKAPELRESAELAGPVVVGARRPVLLWPESFERKTEDEVMAALCHELAHIRRRDYAMNLACEAAALPVRWHPVTYGVAGRLRSTREMACDAMAAAAMESETVYARCLMSLAQSMVTAAGSLSAPVAAGLFNGNALEERMMRLMKAEASMSWQAKAIRGVAGAAAMVMTVGLAAGFHVVPALAQSDAGQKVTGGVQSGTEQSVRDGVADGVQNGVVAPEVKVRPTSPLVTVSPVVRVMPLEKLAMVSPVVNVVPMMKVSPVMTVTPLVKVRPVGVLVKVSPVIHVTPEIKALPKVQAAPEPQEKPKGAANGAGQGSGRGSGTGSGQGTGNGSGKASGEGSGQGAGHLSGRGAGHRMCAVVDGQVRELTPEEQRRVEKQLADAQKQIADATARLNSPEFRKQIEDAQQKAMDAERKLQSGEFQKQMADAQKELAVETARLNSPEFKAQMEKSQRDVEEAMRKMNNGEFQKQMADAQKQLADAMARMKAEQEKNQK
jgi:beta-lactamase regulating signal transducer with metallopeptidase domain